MAWERSFEARVLKIREKELKYQRLCYIIEVGIFRYALSSLGLSFFLIIDAFQQYMVSEKNCP